MSAALADFLLSERERHAQLASPLPEEKKSALRAYFRADLLDATKIRQLSNEKLRNPDFYPRIEAMGVRNLPDLSQVEAITFQDVVVFAERMTTKLLFHELVHAEQFRQLGVTVFARRYVDGFLRGGAYEAIPLEIHAYGLGAHYEAEPQRPFSVEEEVSRWISEGKF